MSICEWITNTTWISSALAEGFSSDEAVMSSVFPKEVLVAVGVGYLLYQGVKYIRRPPRHVLSNGDCYEGYAVNGKREGKGKYTYSNGSCYEGDFVNGKQEGKGKYTYSSGSCYEGDWVNGKQEGKGKYTNSDGACYEGDWVNGKEEGKGKYTYSDGDCYEGDWVNGKEEGKGKYTYSDGACYEGDWVNGKMQGKGKYTSSDGACFEGMWLNGEMVSSGIDHLGDDLFFDLLCGFHQSAPPNGYCLGVVLDYLQKNGYEEMAASLREARRYSIMNPEEIERESHVICRELKHERKSKLICYGYHKHAMLLNLVPDVVSGFIICEIFNSGEGLGKYHEKKWDYSKEKPRMKYKTILQVKVPVERFTPQLIQIFLSSGDIEDENEAYGHILNLPGAEVLPSSSSSWQTEQKGNDCSLQCFIKGLFEHKMPEPERLRRQMKEDCRQAHIEKKQLSFFMDRQLSEQEG